MMEEVTDPDVLKAFGVSAPSPGATSDEEGLEEVTDPTILQAFEANARDAAADDPNQPIERGKDAGLKAAYVKGFSSDENETVRYLASQLYPKEPLDQAVKRFGNRDGTIYHLADDGKYYEALPGEQGWGPRDVAGWAAQGVGPALPMVSGASAGIATAPAAATGVGLVGTMAAAGGAGMAGEAARQKIGDMMMGEASTNDLNVRSMAAEGVTNALGQGIGSGIGMAVTKNAVRDINKLNPAQTQRAYDEAANAGVWITPAEATGLPSLAAQQKRLTNITPTADEMRTFLDTRDQQVVQAWSGYLDNISAAADAEEVGMMGREAAAGAIAEMRAAASAAADPFYKAAHSARVTMTPELTDIAKRPAIKDAAKQALKLAENAGDAATATAIRGFLDTGTMTNMKGWDYVKRGVDEVLGSSDVVNAKTGGFNQYGNIVQSMKGRLLGALDEQVPEYGLARSIYSHGIDDATTAMESALGTLSKMKDTGVLSAARHIFDPRTRSPEMVLKVRGALEKKNPAAWQGLKRLYIQDVTLGALRMAEQGNIPNPAGKLHKAFIDPSVRANLRAAMTAEEFARMNDLLVVFKRAASVPALRSDTAFNAQLNSEAIELAKPVLAKIAGRNVNPFAWGRAVEDYLTNRSLEKNAERAVKLITSGDPQAINAMKELKRLSPMSRNWLAIFGHLVGRGGAEGAEELAPNANYGPSAQPQ